MLVNRHTISIATKEFVEVVVEGPGMTREQAMEQVHDATIRKASRFFPDVQGLNIVRRAHAYMYRDDIWYDSCEEV